MSTPSWAKRYVPSSVALEHFALEAFSSPFSSPLSSAYPAPPARTPAPTTSSTSTTPAAHIPLRFIRVVLLWYEPSLTASKVPLLLSPTPLSGAFVLTVAGIGSQHFPQMSDFCCILPLQESYKRPSRCMRGLFTEVRGRRILRTSP